MYETKPLGTALAFALTAGIVYPLCALVFLVWPDAAQTFIAALFHGIDLTMTKTSSETLNYWQVFLGVCGVVLVAFLLGLVYAWMNNLVRALFFRTRAL